MSQPQKKGWLASMSPLKRTVLGISIIVLIIIVGVIYGPHYDDDDTTTGDSPPPTVTVIDQVGLLNVNRSFVHQGITMTVTSVEQAQSFSDDGKSSYAHVKYILRVNLHVQAPASQSGPIGVDYSTLSHLVLANGTILSCDLAQISPDVLPGQDEDGFLDFWVNTQYNLSSLGFVLGSDSIAFG
jgi:hypothetical protein